MLSFTNLKMKSAVVQLNPESLWFHWPERSIGTVTHKILEIMDFGTVCHACAVVIYFSCTGLQTARNVRYSGHSTRLFREPCVGAFDLPVRCIISVEVPERSVRYAGRQSRLQ